MIDTNFLPKGSCISEASSYITLEDVSNVSSSAKLLHVESGEEVNISFGYLRKHCHSAEIFHQTVEVTKDDKRDGTPGIRTIFKNFPVGKIFTVCYRKQDKDKSKTALAKEKQEFASTFEAEILKAKNGKKSMSEVALEWVERLIENPIVDYIPGEKRILRGYKTRNSSSTGFYDVIDVEASQSNVGQQEYKLEQRLVNVNTIEYFIADGVKYVVK